MQLCTRKWGSLSLSPLSSQSQGDSFSLGEEAAGISNTSASVAEALFQASAVQWTGALLPQLVLTCRVEALPQLVAS